MPSDQAITDHNILNKGCIANGHDTGRNGAAAACEALSKQPMVARSPEKPALPRLQQTEHRQFTAPRGQEAATDPVYLCVPQMFEDQVDRTPDAIAVEFDGQNLSYRELNLRANQLAHYLRDRGVGPEVLVGICVWRSLDTVIAVLAVLKAGGAYVPLDPLYPQERLAFMLEDAQAPLLLTQESLRPCLTSYHGRLICLDSDWPTIARERDDNPAPLTSPDNIAYVIFTSGSTGQPKGVQVLSCGLVNILDAMRREPGLTEHDIWLSITTLSFDIATLELLLPLVVGARLVLAGRGAGGDGARLAQLLADSGATILQATPATWRLLVQAGWRNGPLRKAFAGGEALPRTLANQLLDQGVELWNLYGPTETTIYSTGQQVVSRDGPVPIGRPVAKTEAYVLDADLHPVPPGESGELHLGGAGLARGYLNRPEQTNARFIPNPFSQEPGARLYKTGDLCRFLPDGTLEYLGRLDHQVKIHGHRIELGEIEAALASYPAIRQSLVVARDDESGNKRLVAYLVAEPAACPSSDALRSHLRHKLPSYMLPSAFVLMDAFPLTPNGKVDRRALPEPRHERSDRSVAVVRHRTDLEKKLICIWQDLLKVHPIGITDDFFELGGDSILAAHMLIRLRDAFGHHLPMSALIQGTTVEYLASLLTTPAGHSSSLLVPIQPSGSKPPLFFVHGVGGEVVGFLPLARRLGQDQPLYAFQAQGADGTGEPLVRIEEMAARYLEELLAVQPHGPLFLGGYSFGSVVAFEMARQLQARGRQVGMLIIMDQELACAYKRVVWQPRWLLRFAQNIPRWVFHDIDEWQSGDWYARFRQKLVEVKEKLKVMLSTPYGGPAEWGLQRPSDWSQVPVVRRRVWQAHYEALLNYAPGSYRGRALILRARTQALVGSFEPDLGWRHYAAGGVKVATLPGFHTHMLKEPYVGILARRLRQELEKPQAESKST
jgi:amino acid adenylation domain-containing protein